MQYIGSVRDLYRDYDRGDYQRREVSTRRGGGERGGGKMKGQRNLRLRKRPAEGGGAKIKTGEE